MDLIIATIILCFWVAINVVSVLLLIIIIIIIFSMILTAAENCSVQFKIFILISL